MDVELKPIEEQRIVITGASSGIGLATAQAAVRRGARVMLAARDGEALARITAGLNARQPGATGEVAQFRVTDVSVEADIEALAQAAIGAFGGFDSWINDAGVGIGAALADISAADHHRLFEVNYFGVVYGALAATRHFRHAGGPGAIINLGSAVSDMAIPYSVPYVATKHAIKGFTDGLRIELAREGLPVSVTLIKPSAIDTPFFDHARTQMGGIEKPLGGLYAPEVVADAILFAAAHPRRDIAVGWTSAIGGRVAGLAPAAIDRHEETVPLDELIDFGALPDDDNLYHAPAEGRLRSHYGSGRRFSLTTMAQTHEGVLPLALVGTLGALALLSGRGRRRRR